MKKTILTIAAALVLGAAPAVAKTYVCKFDPRSSRTNMIQSAVVVGYDEKTGDVQVNDAVIQYYFERPIKGELKKNTDKIFRVRWEMRDVTGTDLGSGAKMRLPHIVFSLTIQKASLQGNITGRIVGGETETQRGQCGVK